MPKPADNEMISAQDLASRVGEPYDTIDHWAALGLLVFRRRGRTRLFASKENQARCREVRKLQDDGHNLSTIRGMLSNRR